MVLPLPVWILAILISFNYMTEEKRVRCLEIDMATIKNELKNIKTGVDELKDIVNGFIDNADNKYAPMWAANVLTWTGRIIIGGVLIALLGLIGIEFYHF
jgi:hypothetical protein